MIPRKRIREEHGVTVEQYRQLNRLHQRMRQQAPLRFRARISFDPHDIWIGITWDHVWWYAGEYEATDIHLCILPCLPLSIGWYRTLTDEQQRDEHAAWLKIFPPNRDTAPASQ